MFDMVKRLFAFVNYVHVSEKETATAGLRNLTMTIFNLHDFCFLAPTYYVC